MDDPRTHLVFTPSAGEALRRALAPGGDGRDIVCAADDFSFGPLGRTPDERAAWVERILGLTDRQGIADANRSFVAAAAAATTPRIAWVSFDDSSTYAGFLWWLAQAGPAEIMLADAAALRGDDRSAIVAQCRRAATVSAEQRDRWQARWRALEAQDAPFRVVEDGELVSAPINRFDADLLGGATRRWQRMARLVGLMFDRFARMGAFQTSDAVLAARLVALVRDGRLDARGDLSDMTRCELRLPEE